jgi:hypothetical protein
MRRFVCLVLAAVLAFGVAGAWADEVSGTIQSVNVADRLVVLQDGTELWVAEGLSLDLLKEGSSVKATYEERDGKKVVTTMEVSE